MKINIKYLNNILIHNRQCIAILSAVFALNQSTLVYAADSCTVGDAAAGDVFEGKTVLNSTGGYITGTLKNWGNFDLSTTAFSQSGYVNSFTGLTTTSVCSTTSLLGSTGTAKCITGTTSNAAGASDIGSGKECWDSTGSKLTGTTTCASFPALTVTSDDFAWGTVTSDSAKTITLSISSSGATFAKMSFSGTGKSGFTVSSINGTSTSISPSSGDLAFALTSDGTTSLPIKLKPAYVDGTSKTMTITVTDAQGTQTNISASVAYTNPVTSITGLKLWLYADSLSTSLSDGDKVATWTDNSGNSNNLTQSTDSRKMIYKTNILNGHAVVRSDGTDDYFSFTNTLTTIRTAFIVLKNSASSGSQAWAFLFGETDSYSWHGGNGTPMFYTGYTSSSLTNGAAYLNGTSKTVSSLTRPTSFSVLTLIPSGNMRANLLSEDRTYSRSWNGDFAEIIIYDSALSNSDRSKIECYLGTKYNISVTGC